MGGSKKDHIRKDSTDDEYNITPFYQGPGRSYFGRRSHNATSQRRLSSDQTYHDPSSYGEDSYGQSSSDQTYHDPSSYGEDSYGQSSSDQTNHNPSSYGQDSYGQSSSDQTGGDQTPSGQPSTILEYDLAEDFAHVSLDDSIDQSQIYPPDSHTHGYPPPQQIGTSWGENSGVATQSSFYPQSHQDITSYGQIPGRSEPVQMNSDQQQDQTYEYIEAQASSSADTQEDRPTTTAGSYSTSSNEEWLKLSFKESGSHRKHIVDCLREACTPGNIISFDLVRTLRREREIDTSGSSTTAETSRGSFKVKGYIKLKYKKVDAQGSESEEHKAGFHVCRKYPGDWAYLSTCR